MLDGDQNFWLVIWGFIIAFVLAFGIGANDVANSFGTSVGSKVLTLKQACILATIFEILGSILIGAKVSGTIRKGILEPSDFNGAEFELMLGYVSALLGCCVWLILATILNLPVSGTHSIVGATIGMAIVSRGFSVIKWIEVLKIVASWFISPILSGVVSLLMFILIRKYILRAGNPLKAGLRFLPLIYTITIFVNLGGILESSPPLLGFDKIPWWGKVILVVGISALVYLGVWLVMVPFMKKKVEKTLSNNMIQAAEMEEKERMNELNANSITDKKNISTQVDYIALIMSRNEDYVKFQERNEEEAVDKFSNDNDNESSVPQLNKISSCANSSSVTIHSSDPNVKSKNTRIRLISAPSSAPGKEPYDYGDVNLTLRGYLHTIHHPGLRQQLSAKSQQTQRGSNTRSQLSISNSLNNQKAISGGEASLSKLFVQRTNEQALKEDASVENNQEKRGRFNLVPATISTDVENNNLKAADEKSLSKSLLEIDPDAEEIISELPQKQKKQFDVETDEFANTDPPEAAKLFSFLQVLTAVFGSFAHGGNDVSNAIGPLIGLYLIYQEGKIVDKAHTPEWILFYGGVGISVGLWILGRRVIKTIGEDLTKITASSGFVIELASAMTVLGASLLQIPVSTTHCKVGSVVFTGRVRSKQSVDWSLFRNIIIAWIVTVPVTGSIAAACQFILKSIFMGK